MKLVLALTMATFLSTALYAEDCVFVIMGGKKEWISLLPLGPTDISIDVDLAVKKEAMKSGCRILSMSNDSGADFLEKLKDLKKYKKGTKFHLAFTDHGAPADRSINDSILFTGSGEQVSFKQFINSLKDNIPKDSHVTFQTNNCYANISEAILANQLDQHFDMCGGSSTVAEQMSWNRREVTTYTNGKVVGPYGAVGLRYVNEYKKKYGSNPSMSDFHHHAKKGDLGNLSRQPGLTTSLVFANSALTKLKQSPLLKIDVNEYLLNINWKNDEALDNFLSHSTSELALVTENYMIGSCRVYPQGPFENFLKAIAPLHSELINTSYATLPHPYAAQNKEAIAWMKTNQKKMASLLSMIAIERAQFVKKNKHYPREKYAEIEAQWVELKNKHSFQLRDYEFNLRVLQEGLVIQKFLSNASDGEKTRFQKLVDCENRPVY